MLQFEARQLDYDHVVISSHQAASTKQGETGSSQLKYGMVNVLTFWRACFAAFCFSNINWLQQQRSGLANAEVTEEENIKLLLMVRR